MHIVSSWWYQKQDVIWCLLYAEIEELSQAKLDSLHAQSSSECESEALVVL